MPGINGCTGGKGFGAFFAFGAFPFPTTTGAAAAGAGAAGATGLPFFNLSPRAPTGVATGATAGAALNDVFLPEALATGVAATLLATAAGAFDACVLATETADFPFIAFGATLAAAFAGAALLRAGKTFAAGVFPLDGFFAMAGFADFVPAFPDTGADFDFVAGFLLSAMGLAGAFCAVRAGWFLADAFATLPLAL